MPWISLERRQILIGTKKAEVAPNIQQKKDVVMMATEAKKKKEKLADTQFFTEAVCYRQAKALEIAQQSGVLGSLHQLIKFHQGDDNSYQLITPLINGVDDKTNQRYDLDYGSKLAAWRMQTKFFGSGFTSGLEHELHPLKLQASLHPELRINTHVLGFLNRSNKKEFERTKGKLKQLFPIYTITLVKGKQAITSSEDIFNVPLFDIKAEDKVMIQISTNPYYPSVTILGAKNEGTFTPKDWKIIQRPKHNKQEQAGGLLGFRTRRDDIQEALLRAIANPLHDQLPQDPKIVDETAVIRRRSSLPPLLLKSS